MRKTFLLMSGILVVIELIYAAIRWHTLESREIEAQTYALIAGIALFANLYCFKDDTDKEQLAMAKIMQVIFVCLSVGYQVHNICQLKPT